MGKYYLEKLKGLGQHELNELLDKGVISYSDWVEAQPDTYDGYAEWLERNGYERSDEAAQIFVHDTELDMMEEEKPAGVQRIMQQCMELRNRQNEIL